MEISGSSGYAIVSNKPKKKKHRALNETKSKMSYNLISGMSQQYFHTIPSDTDLITTTPTREGIFKYLSQIGYDKFPEFVLDILTKIDGHKALDVTDGQGDEKQDIITLNQKGERCLTQCKHTVNYKSHYNGDDLDLMVAACMRKNCKEAIFITNSDLTPQGKKYVTDEEYNRGFNNPEDCPSIDYWNGYKIWEKIKTSQDIINKWFSGLGQVHGLRSFKFDLTIQELPLNKQNYNESDAFDNLLSVLSELNWIEEISKGLHYKANINEELQVNIKRWFQFAGGLDLNFVLPEDDLGFFDRPLFALTIEVVLNDSKEKYTPQLIQKTIIQKLTNDVLKKIDKKKWWHLTASQIKSFIYLHDISEPREIDLTSAKTFIKTEFDSVIEELDYCMLSQNDFDIDKQEDDDIGLHKETGIQVIQMFEQKINPVEQYNHQLIQYHNLKNVVDYNFYAIKNIESSLIMRVRRLLHHEWVAIQQNEDVLIWAIPPTEKANIIQDCHNKIRTLNLTILQVRQKDAKDILEKCQKDLVPSSWMFTSNISHLSFPIMLDRRIFWLSKELEVSSKHDLNKLIELLEYKYSFEHQHGFDSLMGNDNQQINTKEIKDILFDVFTFRGSRMLDISTFKNPISINIRFKEGQLGQSNDLALSCIEEFNTIYKEIRSILN